MSKGRVGITETDEWIMKSSLLVICLAAMMFNSVARGDGKMYGQETVTPKIPYQRALILFKDGTETLLIQSKYEIPKTVDRPALGWVVPVPSVPEVASMPAVAAQELFSFFSVQSRPHVTLICPRLFSFLGLGLACLSILIMVHCLVSFFIPMPQWLKKNRGVFIFYGIIGFLLAVVLTRALAVHRESAGVDVIAEHHVGIYDV